MTRYPLGIAGTAVYLYSIWIKKTGWLIFGAAAFGFFTSIGWTVILNFGGEIIYPEPESTGTTMSMMITSFLTSIMSYAIRKISHFFMLYRILCIYMRHILYYFYKLCHIIFNIEAYKMSFIYMTVMKSNKTHLYESRNGWHLNIFDECFVRWSWSAYAVQRNFE